MTEKEIFDRIVTIIQERQGEDFGLKSFKENSNRSSKSTEVDGF
ncbi:acyl carrier protein [Streptococcus pneumoniae]|nr:acyl carrier protein [Streptococcus pneumoniae]